MRVVNNDATSYQSKYPKKFLETAEKEREKKYLDACLKQRIQFTPFLVSVDGLLGVEREGTLKCIAICLTMKWKEPYSHTCGYVKSRIVITLV